jgi:general secretion pathway protein D
VIDFPRQVQQVRSFVQSLESGSEAFAATGSAGGAPLEVAYFKTQHIPARSAEQALAAVLSKSGRIGVMEREDTLVISDHAVNLAMIEKVLLRIDQPRPQVRITALIYDISLQDVEKLGINWNQVGKARINADGDAGSSLGVDSILQIPLEAGAAGSSLTFLNLSRHLDITAVAVMLANAKDARLMGNPNVAVIENEEAIFQSVAEIPYQQLTQTSAGGQIGTTSFKEAGITLRVKPKIAADDTIAMQVMPEFSRLAGFTPGDNQPIIDRRTASTMLRVYNRQTVVIGGLRQRSDIGDFKGVPYLKDVPGVGRVFRSRDTDVRESELVVFIMPEIIGPADNPSPRNQLVADTLNCRLDQIPVAEGGPPIYRRLPYDPATCEPNVQTGATVLPPVALQPVYQTSIAPSPRRLPVVTQTRPVVAANPSSNMFGAPPTIHRTEPVFNARRTGPAVSVPR